MKSPKTFFFVAPVIGALLLVLTLESHSFLLSETANADNAAGVAGQDRDPRDFFEISAAKEGLVSLGPTTGRKGSKNNSAKLPKRPKVEVFVATWCPYCQKLENFLKNKGINYSRLDIENSVKAAQLYGRLGSGGVPITKIGDSVIRGYDPNAIMRVLSKYAKNTPKNTSEL